MDNGAPAYTRYWAWTRLLKAWGSLRFDDLRWTDPAKVEMLPAGLQATLQRTKVSGPGKRVRTLVFHVSHGAYLEDDGWLSCGFEVWRAIGGGFPFFVGRPTPALEGFSGKAAGCREASAASQALFADLVDADLAVSSLLPPEGGLFWTEHSERNFLPSVAAAMGKDQDLIRRLGRWQADCSEKYVRTAIPIIGAFQEEVATLLRQRGPDVLGEEAVLDDFAVFLGHRGGPSDSFPLRWRGPLTWFRTETPGWFVVKGEGAMDEAGKTPEPSEDSDDDVVPPVPAAGYVVSITGRRTRRRLHHTAKCPLVPGVHYLEFETYGDEAPLATQYHDFCRRCWPTRRTEVAASVADVSLPIASSASEGSGSSSSSSSD